MRPLEAVRYLRKTILGRFRRPLARPRAALKNAAGDARIVGDLVLTRDAVALLMRVLGHAKSTDEP